eukprot:m.192834 g.192834  ORF g.192834 m.192834 type:complete len:880 (+) comp16773_c1_seq2:316-2955(+)
MSSIVPHVEMLQDPLTGEQLNITTCVQGSDGWLYNAQQLNETGVRSPIDGTILQFSPLSDATRGEFAGLSSDVLTEDTAHPRNAKQFIPHTLQKFLREGKIPLYQIPRYVFFGDQGDGVSSIVERLIEWRILPENTRVPIVIEFVSGPATVPLVFQRQEDDQTPITVNALVFNGTETSEQGDVCEDRVPFVQLKESIRSRMNALVAPLDQAHGTSVCLTTEIVVRLSHPDYPTIALVDLPGYSVLGSGKTNPNYAQDVVTLVRRYLQGDNVFPTVVARMGVHLPNVKAINLAFENDDLKQRSTIIFTRADVPTDILTELNRLIYLHQGLLEEFAFDFSVLANSRRHNIGPNGVNLPPHLLRAVHSFSAAEKREEELAANVQTLGFSKHFGLQAVLATVKAQFDEVLDKEWIFLVFHRLQSMRNELQAMVDDLSPYFCMDLDPEFEAARKRVNDVDAKAFPFRTSSLAYVVRKHVVDRAAEVLVEAKRDMHEVVVKAVMQYVEQVQAVEEGIRSDLAALAAEEDVDSPMALSQRAKRYTEELAEKLTTIADALEANGISEQLGDIFAKYLCQDTSEVKLWRFSLLNETKRKELVEAMATRVDAVLCSLVRNFSQKWTADDKTLFSFRVEEGQLKLAFLPVGLNSRTLAGELGYELVQQLRALDFDQLHQLLYVQHKNTLDITEDEQVVEKRQRLYAAMQEVDEGLLELIQFHLRRLEKKIAEFQGVIGPEGVQGSEAFDGLPDEMRSSLDFIFRQDPVFVEIKLKFRDDTELPQMVAALDVIAHSRHVTDLTIDSASLVAPAVVDAVMAMLRQTSSLHNLTFNNCDFGTADWLPQALINNRSLCNVKINNEASSVDHLQTLTANVTDTHTLLDSLEINAV